MEASQFPGEKKRFLFRETKPKSFHLFNCDNTYSLDVVETLLLEMKRKLDCDISIVKHYFPLSQMSEMCSTTIPELQMDFAVFVVHANESMLSINEDSAGPGYTKIYRALLQATGEKVVVVIGGDDNYKNEDEEERVVVSRWSRRKVSSQFTEEFMDGKKSFVFSWDKKHRLIHEAALLHYFDANKIGQKFEYQPPKKQENAPASMEGKTREVLKPLKQKSEVEENPSDIKGDETTSDNFQVAMDTEASGSVDDTSVSAVSHDKKTLLLKTRMYHGTISYDPDDVEVRKENWKAPKEMMRDLLEKWKNTPKAELLVYREIQKEHATFRMVVKPMIHGSTFVEQQMLLLLFNKC